MKLRTRFAVAAVALVLLVLGTAGVSLHISARRDLEMRWRQHKTEAVSRLTNVSREATLDKNDFLLLSYNRTLLNDTPAIVYAVFMAPDGTVVSHSDAANVGAVLDDDVARKALAARDVLFQGYQHPSRGPISEVSSPVRYGDDLLGVCRIGYSQDAIDKDIEAALRRNLLRLAPVFGGTAALGLLGAFLMAGTLTRPLRVIVQGAREIAQGRLDHRIPLERKDELGALADEFNQMAQALGQLDEMKNDFIASVSHELRSPLTAIRTYLDLIAKEHAGKLPPELHEDLTVVRQNAKRLADFINDILDIARIDAGMAEIHPERTRLEPLVQDTVKLFQAVAQEKGCRIDVRTPDGLPALNADPNRVRQVLTNLVSNALKFCRAGGAVTITASVGWDAVECAVADDGAGLPPEALAKVFGKFQRLHADKNVKGTGLGLAISKGIVEAHGGRIWAENRPEGGAVFRFTLPSMKG